MSTIKNKTFEAYTLDELASKNVEQFLFLKKTAIDIPKDQKTKKDDDLKSEAWTEAYKTAGYYLDKPTEEARNKAFSSFRFNFGSLLSETKSEDRLPQVNTRKEFLTWVCKKHNEFLEIKGAEQRVNCDYNSLKKNYGPNEKEIKSIYGSSLDLKY